MSQSLSGMYKYYPKWVIGCIASHACLGMHTFKTQVLSMQEEKLHKIESKQQAWK